MHVLVTGTLAFLLDRLTKLLLTLFIDPGESVPLIKGIFHISLVHNTGIAFGLFKDETAILLLVSLIALILIPLFYRKFGSGALLSKVSLGLIIGGAAGNLYDRLTSGFVIDFLDFRIWPVFNIADSCITIGCILLFFQLVRGFKR